MNVPTPLRSDLEVFIKDRQTIDAFELLFEHVKALTPLVIVKAEPAIITPAVAVAFQTVSTLPLAKADLRNGMWAQVDYSGRYNLGAAETIQISLLDRVGTVIGGLANLTTVGPANLAGFYHYGSIRFMITDPIMDAAVPVRAGGTMGFGNSNGLVRAVGPDGLAAFPSVPLNANFNADGNISLAVRFGSTSVLNAIDFSNVYWSIFTPGE